MSHYINLLEEHECIRISTVEVGPLYKIGGAAVGVALLGLAYSSYAGLAAEINRGEELSALWKKNEKPAAEAEARAETLTYLQRDIDTLDGWSASRTPWPEILDFIASAVPEPAGAIQFTRLFFDEQMEGVRKHAPERDPLVHPLRREVILNLRGYIQSDRPEAVLGQFQQNLFAGKEGLPPFIRVQLQGNMQRIPDTGKGLPITQFDFILELQPRSLLP